MEGKLYCPFERRKRVFPVEGVSSDTTCSLSDSEILRKRGLGFQLSNRHKLSAFAIVRASDYRCHKASQHTFGIRFKQMIPLPYLDREELIIKPGYGSRRQKFKGAGIASSGTSGEAEYPLWNILYGLQLRYSDKERVPWSLILSAIFLCYSHLLMWDTILLIMLEVKQCATVQM